jgi:hypothetical protein
VALVFLVVLFSSRPLHRVLVWRWVVASLHFRALGLHRLFGLESTAARSSCGWLCPRPARLPLPRHNGKCSRRLVYLRLAAVIVCWRMKLLPVPAPPVRKRERQRAAACCSLSRFVFFRCEEECALRNVGAWIGVYGSGVEGVPTRVCSKESADQNKRIAHASRMAMPACFKHRLRRIHSCSKRLCWDMCSPCW